ncbi:MAG: AmmeMemoRadiSam system protein A [bacterium]|nr:AmmeMemoRadiSam system protein A [bacterium]
MHPLVSLAKIATEEYVGNNKVISPPKGFPEEFLGKRAGTFVTIERKGELRGCVGTYLSTKDNVAEEIIANAIAAASEDSRFPQVSKEELPDLSYIIYILKEPEQTRDLKELNPKKYGIIVKAAGDVLKSGLLLPDLEGVNSAEQQVSIACQKGGIDPEKENVIIYRFTVKKYE